MSSGQALPSGTVTFLFTDIEGSTRLVKLLGDAYEQVLAEHQDILRVAFAEHGGREIDTQGDSFFVAFSRARDAVNAAVAAQRALIAAEWPEGAAVKVRMGIHTGEPVVGEQRYTGMGVHRAARVSAVGHGGQVLVSNATRELIEDDLPPGVTLRDLGRHKLKDIQRPERIYQVVAEGLPSKFPPLKSAGATSRARHLGRRGLVVAGVVVAGVAAAVVLLTRGGSETARASIVAPNSVGIVDPEHGSITAQTQVGASPSGVASGANAVWVANNDAVPGTVSRIDPSTRSVRQTIDVGGGPSAVTVGGGGVWVTNGLDGTISRIDPETNQVVKTIRVGAGPTAVAWGAGAVWVANSIDGTVSRIDPVAWGVTKTYPVAIGASAIAVGFDRVWVASQSPGVVVSLDPHSGAIDDPINVGVDPGALAVGAGAVWVANRTDGTVMRIDPGTRSVTKTIPVGRRPAALAVSPKVVWVANSGDGTLSRIDPARDAAVVDTVTLGNPPGGIALTPGGLYVAVRSNGLAHRGGTLRVWSTPFITDTMDPSLSYNWQITGLTHDGLLGYRRVGGVQGNQVVPDLAESLATPTDGGRTYTYVIRPGLHYSNGRPVEPADFRHAFERLLRLHSPDASYYAAIVGARACLAKPKRCDLSTGIVTDSASRTVTFHLTEPDGEFQSKLALPFTSAVPSDTPFRDLVGRAVPGTGPYRISRVTKRGSALASVVLVRNPTFREWSTDAQPQGYPDVITVHVDFDLEKRVRPVERNSADVGSSLFIGAATRERLADLASRYPGRLLASTSAGTDFMFMNTRVPPFNDVRVRRAVSLAIDRGELVRKLGEYAHAATCHILPPNFRGYVPACPLQGGFEAGRRLVVRSGTSGQRVVVWVPAPAARIGTYFVSLLDQLGFRAGLKKVDPAKYFAVVGDSRQRPQIGFGSWFSDYPSPAGFLPLLFTCASFVPANGPANVNFAEFCDPAVDRQLRAAAALQAQNPAAATVAWQKAERTILELAPIVPMDNTRNVDLVSKRLGNYQYSPQFGLLLDQAWVK